MRLLLVHGRSQGGKDPVKLKAEWLDALTKGLQRIGQTLPKDIEIDFPFYGDKLDDFVRQFELPADPAFVPKGSPVFDECGDFRREIAEEMCIHAGITEQQIREEMKLAPIVEKGVENWEWVQAIIRLLDRNFTNLSQGTINVFLRDVFLYVKRDAVRTAIDEIVAEGLKPDTVAVLGHSLGSVVAYNVLNAAGRELPFYVTVGSPLGIRAIRKTLGPIENPVARWYNAFDERDVVALYPLDKKNFDVEPPILNNDRIQNWTSNHHGIAGYLDDINVARTILSGVNVV